MSRLLIVGRITPGAEERVAQVFTESDRSELPGLIGVRHRSLYCLGDLYAHLLETEAGPDTIERMSGHPLFVSVSRELSSYISPYLATWRSPRDAVARCFYEWNAPAGEPVTSAVGGTR